MLTRRTWLTLGALGVSGLAHAEDLPLLEQRELPVPEAWPFGKRCLLLRPRRVPASKALPLLVLLHGLGETDDESRGIHAWANLYGLLDAYERLPLAVSDLAIVCPFTPNPLTGATFSDTAR